MFLILCFINYLPVSFLFHVYAICRVRLESVRHQLNEHFKCRSRRDRRHLNKTPKRRSGGTDAVSNVIKPSGPKADAQVKKLIGIKQTNA